MTDAPLKDSLSDRRDFGTSQPSAAIAGVVSTVMSCPYRHMPASRRRLSLAARPAPADLSAVGKEGVSDAGCELRGAVAGLGWDADFEAVFAGVAGARDEEGGGVEGRGGGGFGEGELEPAAVAEVEGGEVRVDGGVVGVVVGEGLEEGGGGGALEREE